DSSGRALLRIRLRHPTTAAEAEVDAWVDTGFNGDLVLPQAQVVALGLPLGPAVRATLADASEVLLDTYTCLLEWFGELKEIEVIINPGRFPLLGVGLMQEHELHINYRTRTMSLDYLPAAGAPGLVRAAQGRLKTEAKPGRNEADFPLASK